MSPYPADLGVPDGRVVVDNGAPPLDGDAYTLTEVVKPDPPPDLLAIYPTEIEAGGPNVELHCFGTGFDDSSRIVIADHIERTTYRSSGELTTWIEGALWTGADPAVEVYVTTQNGDTDAHTFAVLAA